MQIETKNKGGELKGCPSRVTTINQWAKRRPMEPGNCTLHKPKRKSSQQAPNSPLLLCFPACSVKAKAIISKQGDQVKKMKAKRAWRDTEFNYGHSGSAGGERGVANPM